MTDDRANETDAGAQLRLRILGSLVVEDVDITVAGSRKARTLLTLLAAARGRAVPIDVAADVVWGTGLPASPGDQLSVLASRLRHALGRDSIVRVDGGYELRAGWIDVVEVDALVADAARRLAGGQHSAAMAAAAAALALDRGPLAMDESSDWFEADRARTAASILHAHGIVAEVALATGDYWSAVSSAQRLLDADPYDEVALRIVMRAHAAAGRPASALAAYAAAKQLLAEELGVSPSGESVELHAALLRDELPARQSSRRPIVGRERELNRLEERLRWAAEGRSSAIVVEGEPGIGKSTLAADFAVRCSPQALVLLGRCDPLGRDLPLDPILATIRPLVDSSHPSPSLTTVLDALDGGGSGRHASPTTAVMGWDDDRSELHRALLDVLVDLAAGRPIVFVLDDLHWAGPSTLEWLRMAVRSADGLLVVATRLPEGPADLVDADRLTLEPFDVAAVADLLGAEHAVAIHRRTGGLPLLVDQLAGAGAEEAPPSVGAVSVARAAALGPEPSATITAAAVLGPRIDLDLLAGVLRRSAVDILEQLDASSEAHLIDERSGVLSFRHEVVREALASSASAPRRALLHQAAADVLARRGRTDAAELAWHARLAGDSAMACRALAAAAEAASRRFEVAEADLLLTEALDHDDDAAVRLSRAAVRLASWRLDDAASDVDQALRSRYDARALELAGWIAYYRRDHDSARAFADAGLELADDADLRASLLALGGRLRHSRGELHDAARTLTEAVSIGAGPVRGLASIWLGSVRIHTGSPGEAATLASRGLVGALAGQHPFAQLHALYVKTVALGQTGRIVEAFAALDRLDAEVAGEGLQGRRFVPVAANIRAWLVRNLGRTAEADDLNAMAIVTAQAIDFAEPRYVGHLDLVEGQLLAGDGHGAGRMLADIASIDVWQGTMAWRQRDRYRLQQARVAMLAGDADGATAAAERVAAEAGARGSARYELFAELVVLRAAWRSRPVADAEHDRAAGLLVRLDDLARPEGWWITAEVAAAAGDEEWWRAAERRVGELAERSGAAGGALSSFADGVFTRLR